MKYHELLHHRDALLQKAKLANLAYAHQWLTDFAGRIAQVGLHGQVALYGPDDAENRPEAILVAQNFSQALIEEHFLPEEIVELHAVLALVHSADHIVEAKFGLEEIGRIYVPALRRVLELEGVFLRPDESTIRESDRDAA